MPRVTLRPQAEIDILEIWTFIADDSVIAADRWIDELHDRLALWSSQPKMGTARDELGPGIRSLPTGRYVVFFEPLADGIDVIRVLHSSRDVDQIFGH